jgi:hypothetical protein
MQMSGSCTEDQFAEQPAIQLLAELGWMAISTVEEVFGAPATCCCLGFCQGLSLRAGLA